MKSHKYKKFQYIFGPVPSRRLGQSLGIDLVPHKTCSLDCVYCECGATTNLTMDIKEYVSTKIVKAELELFKSTGQAVDFITFSGSGEPTLGANLGKIIKITKELFNNVPVAVLTNSTTIPQKKVRETLALADVVVPSLDGISEAVFKKINAPFPSISSDEIIQGLIAFRAEFSGKLNLEIFIIPGLNDTDSELSLFKEAIKKISPDVIQLNTLDRPGTKNWVSPATNERLAEIKTFFKPFPVEITAKKTTNKIINNKLIDITQRIVEIISRRPCTVNDLAEMLEISVETVNKYLTSLKTEKQIKTRIEKRGTFYSIDRNLA